MKKEELWLLILACFMCQEKNVLSILRCRRKENRDVDTGPVRLVVSQRDHRKRDSDKSLSDRLDGNSPEIVDKKST